MQGQEIILWIIAIAGIIYLSIQAALTWAWTQLATGESSKDIIPFSVIIAAHNEYENLKALLPSVLEQDYNDYEVIVVLDRSDDGSQSLLNDFQQKYSQLKYLEIDATPANWSPKKWAITKGVETAKHEHLVFTDADCSVPKCWLSTINAHWGDKDELILGLGMYTRLPGWLNRFIQFETFYTAFQYIGWAKLGFPYMGVGRNLGYTRSFFQRAGGMESIKTHLSGDDDLLINHFADPKRTSLMISPQSHTFSEPPRSFSDWWAQKTRHASTGTSYSALTQGLLGAFHLAHIAFFVTIFIGLIINSTVGPIFTLYIVRMLGSWWLFNKVNQKINQPSLLSLYPALDLLYFIYNLSVVPIGIMMKPAWRRRNLKSPKIPKKTAS